MSTALKPPESDIGEEPLIEVESDLDRRGRLGHSRMVVAGGYIKLFESTVAGEIEVARYSLDDVKAPRTEQLVDAYSILARVGGREVELIRSTNGRTVILSDAAKRLEYLLEGKPMPEHVEKLSLCPTCGRPLGDQSKICPYCIDRRKTMIRLFEYAKPFRFRVFWGTVLTLAGTGFVLLPPKFTQLLLDKVLIGDRKDLFGPLILALVASIVLAQLANMARLRNVAFLSMNISSAIRASLFAKIQRLSLNFYDKRSVGSLMSRMINDTGALYDVLVDGIPVVLNQGSRIILIPVALFIMNSYMAIWVILPVPFVLVAVYIFRNCMTRVWSRFWHNWSRFGSSLNGILQGSRVVKAFHSEEREINRFDRRIVALAQTQYVAENSWATFFPIILLTMAISTVVVWWVGGQGVMNHRMTIGELTAFLAYVGMMNDPLMSLQRIIDWSSRALTAAERVFEIMDTPVDISDQSDSKQMPEIQGNVEFQDVHFGYDKAREVIHGIDFKVNSGEIIGIVGSSGSGKTTLINLLLRFYDPTQGNILFDGVDLTNVKIDDFRRQVGVVLQESYLFPGSIRSNISYGRPDASMVEVIEAAKAANAHHYIVNFPDGYDTYVGERGQRLSGGERQRIAIARAILHNPKVLVLDEATASVDTETERLIQEALERLVNGRTVFAIAHRLSTLRNASRLIVLEEGKIAEIGTHDELLEKSNGVYRRLVEMQQEIRKVNDNFLG